MKANVFYIIGSFKSWLMQIMKFKDLSIINHQQVHSLQYQTGSTQTGQIINTCSGRYKNLNKSRLAWTVERSWWRCGVNKSTYLMCKVIIIYLLYNRLWTKVGWSETGNSWAWLQPWWIPILRCSAEMRKEAGFELLPLPLFFHFWHSYASRFSCLQQSATL